MFLCAVGASQGVFTDSKSLESVVVVDVVGFLTEFALFVMIKFIVMASTQFASDLAVWMDLITELPASGALDKVYLLCPL